MVADLVDKLFDFFGAARLHVQPQQRFRIGHAQVEPAAVAEVDEAERTAVENQLAQEHAVLAGGLPRAIEIGVQRYLGKPYQELDLMRNVYDLLGIARVRE